MKAGVLVFLGILMTQQLWSQAPGRLPDWQTYKNFTYTVLGNSSPRNDPAQDFTLEISFPRQGKALVIMTRKNRTPVVTEYLIAEKSEEKSVYLFLADVDAPGLKLDIRRTGVLLSSPAALEDYGFASFRPAGF